MFSEDSRLSWDGREWCRFFSLAVDNPFAVATAQAKKMGYSDFTEGSAGDKKRKEIAEAVKKLK